MVEYGGVVSQSTGAGAGGLDRNGDLVDFFEDLVGQIAAQPPEILLVIAAIIIVGGFFLTRRSI